MHSRKAHQYLLTLSWYGHGLDSLSMPLTAFLPENLMGDEFLLPFGEERYAPSKVHNKLHWKLESQSLIWNTAWSFLMTGFSPFHWCFYRAAWIIFTNQWCGILLGSSDILLTEGANCSAFWGDHRSWWQVCCCRRVSFVLGIAGMLTIPLSLHRWHDKFLRVPTLSILFS